MGVKIIKCNGNGWYKNKIGHEYTVEEFDDVFYIVKDSYRTIRKDETIIV